MSFYTDVIRGSYYYNSPSRVHDLSMLEPVTRAAVEAILRDAAAIGHPLLVFETLRSRQRQTMLHARGATELQTVGCHAYGVAADLVKNIGGEPSWKGSFDFLGALAKKHGLIWGGDWGQPGVHHTFSDACHVQRIALGDQEKLFAGTWFPDAAYSPYHRPAPRPVRPVPVLDSDNSADDLNARELDRIRNT